MQLEELGLHAGCAGAQAAANSRHQLLWRDRLSKDVRDVHSVEPDIGTGDDDDGDVARAGLRFDFLLHGEAVQRWQDQIENDDVGVSLLENVERGEAVMRFNDVVAGETEGGPIHPSYSGIVFHDENALTLHWPS